MSVCVCVYVYMCVCVYVCMCVYMCTEVGGVRSQWNGDPPTGKSVSVSCRACVRAGEAKLRVNLVLLDRSQSESPYARPAVARGVPVSRSGVHRGSGGRI